MSRLVYLPEARLEVLEAVTYYHDCCPEGLAAEFYRELNRAEEQILMQPEFWRPVGERHRRKLLNRFPYGLVYHPLGDGVLEVVALTHLSRKPGYWHGRSR